MKLSQIAFAALVPSVIFLLSGCSTLLSSVDKVERIDHDDGTPAGFVVTVDEVKEVAFPRLSKLAVYEIYADNENYYLHETNTKITLKSDGNSRLAKGNGIRISGTERGDIEKLNEVLAQKRLANSFLRHWTLTASEMREALNQEL